MMLAEADMCSFNYFSSDFLLIIMEEVCDDNLLNFFMWPDICSFDHYSYSGK